AADALAWAFRDPQWVSKNVLQGLILFIPIAGWAAGLGWMALAVENLRQGRQELPPAGFNNLGKGFSLLAVYVIYLVVFYISYGIVLGLGGALVNTHNTGLAVVGGLLLAIGYLWAFVGGLALQF